MDVLDLMAETDPRLDICRKNIRLAVALRETNYAEVARQAGLSRNALSQFVTGRTILSYANMLRVCDVVQVPIGLLHREDAITESRLRLHRLLERLPAHLAPMAFQAAAAVADESPEDGAV